MLSSDIGNFTSSGLPAYRDTQGLYIPDVVVAGFAEAARKAGPGFVTQTATDMGTPVFAPLQARDLIIEALEKFDPSLGMRARQIFEAGFEEAAKQNFIEAVHETITISDSRWRLQTGIDPGDVRVMRVVPGNSEATKYDPANPNPHAVIQMQFDGTIGGVIYMAHEAGHALADDAIGAKRGDVSQHMMEVQAYLIQHILYNHLIDHPDAAIAAAAEAHYSVTMSNNVAALLAGDAALQIQNNILEGRADAAGVVLFERFGTAWREHPAASEVFEHVGEVRQMPRAHITDTVHALRMGEASVNAWAQLDNDILRIHGRPLALMSAAALFQQAKESESRSWIIDMTLGKYGAKDIVEIMAAAGIEREAQLENAAQLVLASIDRGDRPGGMGDGPKRKTAPALDA